MDKGINRYWKHLTLQDRYDIEDGLNHSYTITKIVDSLRKEKSDHFKRNQEASDWRHSSCV